MTKEFERNLRNYFKGCTDEMISEATKKIMRRYERKLFTPSNDSFYKFLNKKNKKDKIDD